jgi:hypothetical protein
MLCHRDTADTADTERKGKRKKNGRVITPLLLSVYSSLCGSVALWLF